MSGREAAGTMARLLAGLRRRQRALNSLRWAVNGALVGAGAGCTTALIMWAARRPDLAELFILAGVVTVALACIGALAGAMAPISDLALARALDNAGKGQDRFASALQLMGDTHVERARLVVEDAIEHVQNTPPAAALPMRVPRSIRWLPAPFLVLVILLLVLPQTRLQAAPPVAPEITADQWKELADDFNKELAKLPKPLTAEEKDLQKELEKLAEKLRENPDKKDALKDIARLSDRVEKEQRSISAKELSMRKAAKAISRSAALRQLAAKMKAGQYKDASEELKSVASKMQNGELSADAEEFEAIAKDLEKLAKEVDADKELEEASQNAASAASKMNKKELAEALKRMAEQMSKNAGKYQRSDNLARSRSMLDELKRRMNQRRSGEGEDGDGQNPGEGDGNGKHGGGKGGLKAGWGSMAKWDGGRLSKKDEKRKGEMSDAQENQGANTTFEMVSPDEKARSSKRYAELYAEFVQMSEADLDLDSVPVSQREYLRKYFNSIRPKEPAPDEAKPDAKQDSKEESKEPTP